MAFKMNNAPFHHETMYLADKENDPRVKIANEGYKPRYTHRVPKAHGNK